MMGFRLLRSLFKKFSFIRWNFGYNEASHELLFHTMEFRLSQSLSRTLLSFDGISAITEPFHAIKAITEPFSNFHKFFLTMEFWLLRSPSWNLGYHGAFLKLSQILSHDGIHQTHNLWEDTFHIYHKEYLHRIRLVKNLAS
jgi:hypothetical protein